MFESFINNPVKVAVGALIVSLFGAISMVVMPKQLIPEVQNPVLSVETRWPGASPQEIEREIIQPQEEQLAAVEGLIKLTSYCRHGEGEIILEFAIGTDIGEAMTRVNTRLQQVRDYPINAQEPVIEASDSSDRPIARFALTARPPSEGKIRQFITQHPSLDPLLQPALRTKNTGLRVLRLRELYEAHGEEHPELKELLPPEVDLQEVRKLSETVIEARLERVPGVAEADTYGGQEEELQVIVDPEKLAARHLTIADLRAVLTNQNRDISAGDLWEGKRRWVIRTLGRFDDPEDVRRQLLTVVDGNPVYVGDVADVQVSYKKLDSLSRRYGLTCNGLSVRRASGANVLEVMEGIRQAVDELNNGILKRHQLELFQYYDETEYIRSAIRLVQQNIFVGGALTFIVLLLFLHTGRRTLLFVPFIAASAVASVFVSEWFVLLTLALVLLAGFWFGRGALVIGLAIPISVVGTFLMLGLLGRSLNVISLAGLAFAVGMLVDNAVVVLENIFRLWEQGLDARTAAARGTREVAGAVVASTLTTIAVFLPVLFVQETSGQLFRDIALAISFAVGLSMIVSFTIIPTLAARLLVARGSHQPSAVQPERGAVPTVAAPHQSKLAAAIVAVAGLFSSGVRNANHWLVARAYRGALLILIMFGFSVGVSILLWPKVEYLPEGNRNFVFCSLSPPPGYNIEQLLEMGKKMEQDLRPYWDVDPGTEEAARLDYPMVDYYFVSIRSNSLFIGFRAYDERRVRELIPLIRKVAQQFPGTRAIVSQASLFGRGLDAGRSIDVEITGGDLLTLVKLGQRVMDETLRVIPGAQASPRPSLDLSSPEIHVLPKLVEATELGVDTSSLGYFVDAYVDGAYAGDYFRGSDRIDLTIVGNSGTVRRTQDLSSIPVATRTGHVVPLSSIAQVKYGSGPESIMRRERLRAITISVSPPITMPLEEAMERISSQIVAPMQEEGLLDGETMITLSGTADKLRLAWEALRWNLLLALVITYLLMAALFESWLYPLVIIFTVPLGAVGGVLGLALLNLFVLHPLDIVTMLGFIILIGTVVNNAILVVHRSLQQIREGEDPQQAVPDAVQTRIRPIFITTATTVLGLLPLVLFPGAGSELYRGLGAVVLGGLVVSTAFTLFVIPSAFVLTLRMKNGVRALLGLPADH